MSMTLLLPPSLLSNSSALSVRFFLCASVQSFTFFVRQLDYLPCSCAFDADLGSEATVQLYSCAWFAYSFLRMLMCI